MLVNRTTASIKLSVTFLESELLFSYKCELPPDFVCIADPPKFGEQMITHFLSRQNGTMSIERFSTPYECQYFCSRVFNFFFVQFLRRALIKLRLKSSSGTASRNLWLQGYIFDRPTRPHPLIQCRSSCQRHKFFKLYMNGVCGILKRYK